MDLHDYLRIIRRSWALLLIVTLLGFGGATAYALLKTPEFEATTKVFVSTQSATSVSDLAQGNSFTQQVVQSYADIVTTRIVLAPVIDALGLDTTQALLAGRIEASAPLNTVVIAITVTDPSAETAAAIADEIGASLSRVVSELAPTSPGSVAPVKVTIVQPAEVPLAPASPNIPRTMALGLLAGLSIGIGLAVLRSVLDTRVHGLQDITAVSDVPILGGISYDVKAKTRPLIVQDDPRSPRAESFRSLRTNLQFLEFGGRAHSFVFTSSIEGEGKTTTVSNLAITLADSGAKVALVDADMRRPRLASVLGIEGAVGLSDVLIGRVDVGDVLQKWGNGELWVLPAGQIPPNPSELLSSKSATDTIDRLAEMFDVVLIDAPPLLPVSDAAILSRRTGGAIVVVANGKVTRGQLSGALDSLSAVGADVLGLVVTMLPTKGPDAYGYSAAQTGYGATDSPVVARRTSSRQARRGPARTVAAERAGQAQRESDAVRPSASD